jgi:murein DD-endopeptidase MepM/ murein hydrolase activator NlpD
VGGFVHKAYYQARGFEDDLPALTSYFTTDVPGVTRELSELVANLDTVSVAPTPTGGLPEPYRTAATLVLAKGLPPAARAQALAFEGEDEATQALAALDQLYTDDAEAALEVLAVGADLRDRAIARARATGIARPESYGAHRRFLPTSSALHADRLVNGTLALSTALDIAWPIAGTHRVTSGFGTRVHPTLKTRKFHNGVDLGVPIGTPVLAAQAGTARIAEDNLNGKYVVIDHGHGIRTSYCHLDSHVIGADESAAKGQRVGLSGNSGRSTGPHLHFVVRVGRTAIDPERLRRQPVLPPADRPATADVEPVKADIALDKANMGAEAAGDGAEAADNGAKPADNGAEAPDNRAEPADIGGS